MKLLIDAGNSRIKWAWLDAGRLHDPGAAAHGSGEFGNVVHRLGKSGRRPAQILVSSVLASALTESLVSMVASALGAPAHIAVAEAEAAGVKNGYANFRQMGVDRWLAMLAAYDSCRRAVCVVDAGTALTIDVITADGSHQGGLIIPGPDMMRSALLREAAGIRSAVNRLGGAMPEAGHWGRDTESCVRRGGLRAAACLVEDCVKAWARVAGGDCALILTGGDAPVLLAELSWPAEHRPLLVLEGLALRHGGT